MSSSLVDRLRAVGCVGTVVRPADEAYERSRRVWNGLADRRPAAVFYAESVDDVRRGIEVAASAGAPLAVRGGGHSLPGLSTCDGGLILDLSRLNTVAVDLSSGTVEAGGGALLGDLQLGGAVADVSEDATAYSGRSAGYYWIVEPVWDRPEDDERCLAWGRASARRLASLSMAGNYVNEQADAGVDIARSAYGVAKYERLQGVKTKLDPHNRFRLNQNIEPWRTSAPT